MPAAKHWYPGSRNAQLEMAANWRSVLATKANEWHVPTEAVTQLNTVADSAASILADAKNESTRTPVVNAKCKEAFDRLEEVMRDIKRRYFFVPPLTEADLVSLGLSPRDPISTPSGTPNAQVTAETFLIGRHELGIKIVYLTGDPADAANKGYRIWYTVVAQGAAHPTAPEQLTSSFSTQRRKDVIKFDFEDSGKIAFFAIQVENGGKKGPWGPLLNAVIP
ncbi:MAG: hypothetical protein LBO67_06375 [Spirochaetaceae bacterium]|nr:hypothetical protein [Spirochaetaceae bacterium]